jgi:hypothetical protein
MNAKILLIDVETAPALVWTFRLYDQNITIEQVEQPDFMLCYSAKWLGSKTIIQDAICDHKEYKTDPYSDKKIAESAWKLMDEADIVLAHNGEKFDIKWFNTIFMKNGLKPVSPFKSIDTLKSMRANFCLLSNKLDYIAKVLGLGEKVKHEGLGLWKKCVKQDMEAWKKMKIYNRKDIDLLEAVYNKIKPFIKNHPNTNLYSDLTDSTCTTCGSKHLIKRGYAFTNSGKYARFVCKSCGKWLRGKVNVLTDTQRENLKSGI